MSIDRATAAQEMLRRRKARASLLGFTEYTHPSWVTGEHHSRICDFLEAVGRGEIKRGIIDAPPRHSKTELVSRRFPAYHLGKNPSDQIIISSYSDDVAHDISRNIRGIMKDEYYRALCGGDDFVGATLNAETTAGNRWETTEGGIVVAAGIGSGITGRGAHLLLIDDPFKGREDADSPRMRERAWNWFYGEAKTRLMPGGRILIIMCMTGDTPVLMADGAEKQLRYIHPGDEVATYEGGRISTSRVRNWCSSGYDFVFEIKTRSGITVKANARHPFLVDRGGRLIWLRTAGLRKGERILRVTGESGKVSNVQPTSVKIRQNAKACVCHTTTRPDGHPDTDLRAAIRGQPAVLVSSIDTGLLWTNTRQCVNPKAVFALYAESHRHRAILAHTGPGSSALIIVTKPEKSEGCFATTATSRWATGRRNKPCLRQQPTCEIVPDTITEISEAGIEEVFDVEIERTGNFIAGGLISHNTRWHEDDLVGRLLETEPEKWELLSLPAISNEGTDDEQALWPDRYPLTDLYEIKSSMAKAGRLREWNAQYQQKPTAEEGIFIKREWFTERYDEPPELMRKYMASDLAVTDKKKSRFADWTVHIVGGLGADGRLYVVDGWRRRSEPNEWIDALLDMVRRHKPMQWAAEAGVIRRATEGLIERSCREQKTYFDMRWIPPMSDKAARGSTFKGWASMGRVVFPRNAAWAEEIIEICVGFPTVRFDDAFDAMSMLCLSLDEAQAPVQQSSKKQVVDGYRKVKVVAAGRWLTR